MPTGRIDTRTDARTSVRLSRNQLAVLSHALERWHAECREVDRTGRDRELHHAWYESASAEQLAGLLERASAVEVVLA
jgi:hypothetical protein